VELPQQSRAGSLVPGQQKTKNRNNYLHSCASSPENVQTKRILKQAFKKGLAMRPHQRYACAKKRSSRAGPPTWPGSRFVGSLRPERRHRPIEAPAVGAARESSLSKICPSRPPDDSRTSIPGHQHRRGPSARAAGGCVGRLKPGSAIFTPSKAFE